MELKLLVSLRPPHTKSALSAIRPVNPPDPNTPIYIRRPTLHDLNDCLQLNANYLTMRVWQMNQRVETDRIQVSFNLVHLPRTMTITVPPAEDNLLRCWQRGDCLLSARQQNTIVGFLHMIPDASRRVAYIQRHVVEPNYRKQGIGTALLEQALQWARDHKLRGVMVTLSTKNHPASVFYLARGFVFSGFTEQFHGNQEIRLQLTRSVR